MADGIIYLDTDDEITSAAARIRAETGRRVAVVLPYGSRVATSRINFRLLARDALSHEKRLSIVAGDAATRALAASAGLPAFSSVGEYEASDEAPRPRDRASGTGTGAAAAAATAGAAGRSGAEAASAAGTAGAGAASDATAAGSTPADATPATGRRRKAPKAAAAAAATAAAATAAADAIEADPAPHQATLDEMEAAELAAATAAIETPATVPPPAPVTSPVPPATVREAPGREERVRGAPMARRAESSRNRTPWIVGLAVLGLAVLVAGVGGYLLLPSASITVAPREQSVGPVVMTIVADPAATTPDASADPPVVPAEIVMVDVSTTGTFPATGKRVERAKASGTVRFRNKDFTASNTIPAGSVVSTANGIRFRTNKAVTVPRADIVGLQVFPKSANVKVTAVEAGDEGNVEPNTIVVIPKGEDPISLDVNNPDETTGGKREEFPKVTQEDIDKALEALQPQLEAAFLERLRDPSIASPDATVFPETGSLGIATPTVDPATLVDQEIESFDLGLTASGTATAVNADPVAAVAEERLRATIDAQHRLVLDSIDVEVDPAFVSGGRISFPASATASQTAILDPAAIKAEVMGKSLDEARSILETYGAVQLSAWPDWVSTIPTLDGRVDLVIDEALPVESAPSDTPP